MSTTSTTTNKQLAILTLIYRFRFITTRHVQKDLGQKHIQDSQRILTLMLARELIGRHYSGQHKLAGRSAAYYLLPKGLHLLKQLKPGANRLVLKATYKDREASEAFIQRSVTLGDVNAAIIEFHGRAIELYTQSEMKSYDFLPAKPPHAYVTIPASDGEPDHFLVEICEAITPTWLVGRRLQQYIDYAESEEWESATGIGLPTVLLLCENPSVQSRVRRVANQEQENSYLENLKFLVTTAQEISTVGLPASNQRNSPETS